MWQAVIDVKPVIDLIHFIPGISVAGRLRKVWSKARNYHPPRRWKSEKVMIPLLLVKGFITLSSALTQSFSHTFRFRSITFEGMHWFHSKSAELYMIVKYRSSSISVIIRRILAGFWPFLDLIFVFGLRYRFPFNNFCMHAWISLEVCGRIYHCKIQVVQYW